VTVGVILWTESYLLSCLQCIYVVISAEKQSPAKTYPYILVLYL